jgi:hypothetical protein
MKNQFLQHQTKSAAPNVNMREKFLRSNIPTDPTLNRNDIMKSATAVQNSQILTNPHTTADRAQQKSAVQALRSSMITTNFTMGSIQPEHRKVDLSRNGNISRTLDADSRLSRNAFKSNAYSIVGQKQNAPSSGMAQHRSSAGSEFKTINQQNFRWI